MKFVKGHLKHGGRKKGTPNKFTSIKESFLEVFNELGGSEGLHQFIFEPIDVEEEFKDGKFVKVYKYDVHGNKKFVYAMMSKMLTDKTESDKQNVTINVMPTIKVEVPDTDAARTTSNITSSTKITATRYEV